MLSPSVRFIASRVARTRIAVRNAHAAMATSPKLLRLVRSALLMSGTLNFLSCELKKLIAQREASGRGERQSDPNPSSARLGCWARRYKSLVQSRLWGEGQKGFWPVLPIRETEKQLLEVIPESYPTARAW